MLGFITSRRRVGLALSLSLLTAAPGIARPVDDRAREAAKTAYRAGAEAYRRGDMTTALGHFNAAYELDPNPTLMFNLANVYAALERPKESVRYFRLYLREAPEEMRREDQAAVEALVARLKMKMEDLEPREVPPPERDPTFRVLGWAGVGLGAVAMGAGAIYTADLADWEDKHAAATLASEKARTRDEGESAGRIATGMWITGGALLAAGALLLWLDADEEGGPEGARSELSVGPGQVGWRLTW